MLAILAKIKNKINIPIDIWFFFLFLFSFSFTIRKVLFYFPIEGTFNEYTGIYVYVSDIFLIIAISLWLLTILSNNNDILSRGIKWITWGIHDLYTALPGLLVIFSFISIAWSSNQEIAFFRSVKLLEYYGLYLYIVFRLIPFFSTVPCLPRVREMFHPVNDSNVPRGTLESHGTSVEHFSNLRGGTFNPWRILFGIIIFSGLFQAIIGIIQFIIQKSIGLQFLFESIINPEMPGVAKIIFSGEAYIRAYGLMPHPNILGGFLVFCIILSILYFKLFHLPRRQAGARPASKNVLRLPRETKMFHVEHFSFLRGGTFWQRLIWLALVIQIIALFLTFSKSAIFGLCVSLLYIQFKNVPRLPRRLNCFTPAPLDKNVPRGTFLDFTGWNNLSPLRGGTFFTKLFDPLTNRVKLLVASILALMAYLVLSNINLYYFIIQPINERLFLLNVPRPPAGEAGGTFWHNWMLGSGMGQFVPSLSLFSQNLLLPWQYQPIHNVYLLVWAELGIIGIGLFIWLLWYLFHPVKIPNVPRGTFGIRGANVEHFWTLQSETLIECHTEQNGKEGDSYSILCNDYIELSSVYFKAIFLAFLFIMLFDHYFWDIQQGSLMLWIILGIIAGFRKSGYNAGS